MSARRRRQRRRHAVFAGTIIVVVMAALAVAAIAGGMFDPDRDARSCVIADISSSTEQARPRYVGEFKEFAARAARETSGELCMILAAGDPLGEGAPLFASVAPSNPNGRAVEAEIEQAVEAATVSYAQILENPPVASDGSALVEAAILAADVLEEGDRLLFLSDGFQNGSATGPIRKLDLSSAGIEDVIDELEASGLIADLRGVEITFPLMNFHAGKYRDNSSQAIAVRRFWEAWVARSGAELLSRSEDAGIGFGQ